MCVVLAVDADGSVADHTRVPGHQLAALMPSHQHRAEPLEASALNKLRLASARARACVRPGLRRAAVAAEEPLPFTLTRIVLVDLAIAVQRQHGPILPVDGVGVGVGVDVGVGVERGCGRRCWRRAWPAGVGRWRVVGCPYRGGLEIYNRQWPARRRYPGVPRAWGDCFVISLAFLTGGARTMKVVARHAPVPRPRPKYVALRVMDAEPPDGILRDVGDGGAQSQRITLPRLLQDLVHSN
mmetsp:Transcript_15011/g.39402  ORF Transcript_15011/g.39402 Transcript_15011/m.39402 type:complete len:240 (+) Transcript_15011:604-1323(+)